MSRSLKFHEVFQLEIEGWIRGMKSFNKDFSHQHMHVIIKELLPAFKESLHRGYAFNIIKIANDFAAAKKVCSAKEVAFIILSVLPKISDLSGTEAETLSKLYLTAESEFGGVYQRFGGIAELKKQASLPAAQVQKNSIFNKNNSASMSSVALTACMPSLK